MCCTQTCSKTRKEAVSLANSMGKNRDETRGTDLESGEHLYECIFAVITDRKIHWTKSCRWLEPSMGVLGEKDTVRPGLLECRNGISYAQCED